jgi:hypothetical protein
LGGGGFLAIWTMYHTTANHQIVFTDKDHARIDAYHITMVAGAGRETPPRVAGVAAVSTSSSV